MAQKRRIERQGSIAPRNQQLDSTELQADGPVLVANRALEDLAVKADRRGLIARIEPDEDRLSVAGLTPGHGVARLEPAAEGRDQVRALPSVEDMDLHALADEGKQGGEGFVEVHADAIKSRLTIVGGSHAGLAVHS